MSCGAPWLAAIAAEQAAIRWSEEEVAMSAPHAAGPTACADARAAESGSVAIMRRAKVAGLI
jgi:hypothetical protein